MMREFDRFSKVIQHLEDSGCTMFALKSKQPRLRGRDEIYSSVGLSEFQISAKVDTILLYVAFHGRMPARHLKTYIERAIGSEGTYVQPIRFDEKDEIFWCSVYLQNPTAEQLDQFLSLPFLRKLPQIAQLDVAVDFKPRVSHPLGAGAARNLLLNALTRHLWLGHKYVLGRGNPRLVSGKGGGLLSRRYYPVMFQEAPAVPVDSTVYFGERYGDVEMKIYDKRHDRRVKGKAVALPSKDHRVRCELTLRNKALREYGITRVENLKKFRFQWLTSYFHFRLPAISWDWEHETLLEKVRMTRARLAMEAFIAGGMTEYWNFNNGVTARSVNGFSTSNSEFNERIGKALSRLTKKFPRS